ncbi:uncharacterized protein UHOD_11003 [Ustilago sp. UG-2017b]|nr:uncharacterized protein UHOD_11003 [Ustilago sp. UG-2017b]
MHLQEKRSKETGTSVKQTDTLFSEKRSSVKGVDTQPKEKRSSDEEVDNTPQEEQEQSGLCNDISNMCIVSPSDVNLPLSSAGDNLIAAQTPSNTIKQQATLQTLVLIWKATPYSVLSQTGPTVGNDDEGEIERRGRGDYQTLEGVDERVD